MEGGFTPRHCRQLKACYASCLRLAAGHGLASIAFCCISMSVFMFHNARAAEIAVQEVRSFKADTGCSIEVIFNVFKQQDELIYRQLLS